MKWFASKILLPYPFKTSDIISFYKGTPDNVLELDAVARNNNQWIRGICRDTTTYNHFGIIPPATARVLTKAPVDYMKAMLKRDTVFQELEDALSRINIEKIGKEAEE